MDELEKAKADLDGQKAEVTKLQSQLLAAKNETADATKRAEVAEGVAGKALADLQKQYLDNRLKADGDQAGAEAAEIADLLVNAGNYDRLKQLTDAAAERVAAKFKPGTSADAEKGGKDEGKGDGKPDAERKKSLLSMTPLGRAVIAASKNGGGN